MSGHPILAQCFNKNQDIRNLLEGKLLKQNPSPPRSSSRRGQAIGKLVGGDSHNGSLLEKFKAQLMQKKDESGRASRSSRISREPVRETALSRNFTEFMKDGSDINLKLLNMEKKRFSELTKDSSMRRSRSELISSKRSRGQPDDSSDSKLSKVHQIIDSLQKSKLMNYDKSFGSKSLLERASRSSQSQAKVLLARQLLTATPGNSKSRRATDAPTPASYHRSYYVGQKSIAGSSSKIKVLDFGGETTKEYFQECSGSRNMKTSFAKPQWLTSTPSVRKPEPKNWLEKPLLASPSAKLQFYSKPHFPMTSHLSAAQLKPVISTRNQTTTSSSSEAIKLLQQAPFFKGSRY